MFIPFNSSPFNKVFQRVDHPPSRFKSESRQDETIRTKKVCRESHDTFYGLPKDLEVKGFDDLNLINFNFNFLVKDPT